MDHPTGNLQKVITIAARLGYAAKGVVYILIGGLAFMAAVGLGGQRGGASDALRELALKPFGSYMLGVLAAGLLAYTAWRIIQAVFDAEHKGGGFKGLCVRGGFVISGLIYGALAVHSLSLLLTSSSGGGSTQSRTAMLMSHPGGLVAVFVIGVIFGFVGLRQWWRAWKQSYRKNWHTREMPAHQLHVADLIARWGLTARGFVFLIMSGFICLAAWNTRPSQARGLGGALETLAEQPFGPWLLSVVALGLVAYGIYCFVNARYRIVDA
ncbi:uncharacterized protein DUF1206 [Kushneria sinocarnis]|uniref:Uncharacterized protein DUF1206 n=1 Tax=Kushneria sinocarnis TaxID=595502 RepID=A0A420X186_9GAMM|nr:DUF1206 domain-containing protein [Kushneria sinocarnis]RKR07572.1 uncharacterized protein DUF1206 [Kushneria sinocarnis]